MAAMVACRGRRRPARGEAEQEDVVDRASQRLSRVLLGLALVGIVACAAPGRGNAPADAVSPGSASAAGPSAPPAAERVIVGVPSAGTVFLPHRLAEARGLYLAHGLDAQVTAMKSEAVVAAIASGEVDYSGQFATSVRQRLAGIPITAVAAVVGRSTRQLVAQPQYNSVPELKGKVVVSSSPGGTDMYVMRTVLRFHGLDPEADVTLLSAGDTPARLAALQSGRAEAAMFTVGDAVHARERGFKVLANAADAVDIPENGLAVSERKLAERPDQVKAALAALLDAVDYIYREPQESGRVLAEWTGVDDHQALLQIEAVQPALSRDLTVTDEGLQQTIEAEKGAAGITREVPASEVADFTLLHEVLVERAARH
jgi:ABC-type nitrate/sulfonate/bicarbonate transport system substrate-binding protein